MLPVLHKVLHLFREDAYCEYCWNVDAWGAYQPASFIYVCFEAFRDAAARESLLLTMPPIPDQARKRRGFPTRAEREWASHPFSRHYGLVCLLENQATAGLVEEYLLRGDNVIALLPNEAIGVYSGTHREKGLAEAAACLEALKLSDFRDRLDGKVTSRADVWWEEVSRPNGRLFVTSDGFLSDGYFMEDYGKTESNTQKITDLIRNFATRRKPLLLAVAESPGTHWLCHEPLTLTLRLKNFGPALASATFAIGLDSSCEPTTATEVGLPRMESLGEVTVAFQFIPRVGKRLDPICSVAAQYSGRPVEVFPALGSLEAVASLKTVISTQGVADDADYSRLTTIVARTPQLAELRNFAQLARVDVEACLNKLRKAAEKLALRALTTVSPAPVVRDFNGAIRALQDYSVLSSKAVGYLHTIRVIGNLASHPSGETLTTDDVRVAAFALASVVEEMLDKGAI